MRALILKTVLTLLAAIGIHIPWPHQVYLCAHGRPSSVPSNCEVIKL